MPRGNARAHDGGSRISRVQCWREGPCEEVCHETFIEGAGHEGLADRSCSDLAKHTSAPNIQTFTCACICVGWRSRPHSIWTQACTFPIYISDVCRGLRMDVHGEGWWLRDRTREWGREKERRMDENPWWEMERVRDICCRFQIVPPGRNIVLSWFTGNSTRWSNRCTKNVDSISYFLHGQNGWERLCGIGFVTLLNRNTCTEFNFHKLSLITPGWTDSWCICKKYVVVSSYVRVVEFQ